VEIRRVSDHSLVGSAPENIRHFMELRGIGVINARRMFGMASVKLAEKIALILRIEPWQENKMYMRLGDEDEYMEILGVRVPTLTIPVRPGRNLAVIIAAATMNMRMKAMGYDPARELLKRLGLPDDREEKPPQVIEYNFWDIQ
jgi:HPr kinase/phosphorylase